MEGRENGFSHHPDTVEYSPEFSETTKVVGDSLTFDDVILLPDRTEIEPGMVSTETRLTRRLSLNVPLLSAAMDRVTEWEMAVAMAREGGAGVIHRNLSIPEQAAQIETVKRAESAFIGTPKTVRPETTVGEVRAARDRYGFSTFPVTEDGPDSRLLGLLSSRNYRSATDGMRVGDLMKPVTDLQTLPEGSVTEEAERRFRELDLDPSAPDVDTLPVIDSVGRLCGIFTYKDIELRGQFPESIKDADGRLIVGAAVGLGADAWDRAAALIEAGADFISTDTAHVDRPQAERLFRELTEAFPETDFIAGNIVRGDAAIRFIEAGAAAVKVGLGSGSICSTSIQTGVGRGQLRAVMECAAAAAHYDVPVIADGGIRHPDDVAKAIGAGAESVMIGSVLAGTDESPGEVIWRDGVKVAKEYRGMGSTAAMRSGSADRYFENGKDGERLAEGVEAEVKYRGPQAHVIRDLVKGLEKAMDYAGFRNIDELRRGARFERITPAGLAERYPHDVTVTRDNPHQ